MCYLKLGHDCPLDILSNLLFYFPFDEVSTGSVTTSLSDKYGVWIYDSVRVFEYLVALPKVR
jgi:hypothetical protein